MNTEMAHLFDSTIQKTWQWLTEVQQELTSDSSQDAYRALRAVLMALRDRLTVEEASDLGAQLPMLVRGFYYEQWNPARVPHRERTKTAFLNHVAEILQTTETVDPENAVTAVFRVIQKHVTGGEVGHVKENLPIELREFWPETQAAGQRE